MMCFCLSPSQVCSCCRIGASATIVKWVLVQINISISFTGLVFIGMGLAFLLLEKTVLAWLPWNVHLFALPFISTGIAIYIFTCMGCCGAWKESRTLLALYSLIMTVMIAAQVYLILKSHGNLDQVQTLTEPWVHDAFNKPEWREPFHLLEVSMQCCGSEGAKSYELLKQPLPPSCCEKPEPLIKNGTSSGLTCAPGDSYDGCVEIVPPFLEKMARRASENIYYVIAVEIVAILASSHLFRSIGPN